MQYCSLQHWTLLPSPVTTTTEYCFCFGSVSSFFLELFLHWSPVACWAPTDLGSSSFSILSFCLFILFMGFSRQEYWSGLPFLSPVDHVLSELSTMTRPSWVALHGMAYSFIELDKAVVHVIRLVSFLWLWFSVCLPSDGEGQEAYRRDFPGGPVVGPLSFSAGDSGSIPDQGSKIPHTSPSGPKQQNLKKKNRSSIVIKSIKDFKKKKKRLMEASWWEKLTEGETGSCSDGRGHAQ